MISLSRKTGDLLINLALGGIVAVAVVMTVVAALSGVSFAASVIVGTIAMLLWFAAGLLWLLT